MRRPNGFVTFANDEDYFHIIDILARTYGVLPSEIAKLSWIDLMVCLQSLKCRSDRVARIMKGKGKKQMLFPNISVMDLSDLIR
jgi:hypothetical protein